MWIDSDPSISYGASPIFYYYNDPFYISFDNKSYFTDRYTVLRAVIKISRLICDTCSREYLAQYYRERADMTLSTCLSCGRVGGEMQHISHRCWSYKLSDILSHILSVLSPFTRRQREKGGRHTSPPPPARHSHKSDDFFGGWNCAMQLCQDLTIFPFA